MQFGTNDKSISQQNSVMTEGLEGENNLHNGKIRPNLLQDLSLGAWREDEGRLGGRRGGKQWMSLLNLRIQAGLKSLSSILKPL